MPDQPSRSDASTIAFNLLLVVATVSFIAAGWAAAGATGLFLSISLAAIGWAILIVTASAMAARKKDAD